jgi:hypothetical protein
MNDMIKAVEDEDKEKRDKAQQNYEQLKHITDQKAKRNILTSIHQTTKNNEYNKKVEEMVNGLDKLKMTELRKINWFNNRRKCVKANKREYIEKYVKEEVLNEKSK